jgi:hypothetical protein
MLPTDPNTAPRADSTPDIDPPPAPSPQPISVAEQVAEASEPAEDNDEETKSVRDWGDGNKNGSEDEDEDGYDDYDWDDYLDEELEAWKNRMIMERQMPDQVHLKNLSRAYTGESRNSTFAFGDTYSEPESATLRIWRDCSMKEMGGRKASDDFSEVKGMKG